MVSGRRQPAGMAVRAPSIVWTRARDVGGVVRAEEDDELADLRRQPEAVHRDGVDVELLVDRPARDVRVPHRGAQDAGSDRVHADAFLRPLPRSHARHHDHGRLGCAVGHPAGVGREAADRRDVHDRARLLRQHDPPRSPHAEEDARLHDRDRVVPVLVRDVLGVGADAADAGVVDHDVEPAEVAHDSREGVVHLLAHGHVGWIGASFDTGLRELVGCDPGGVGVDLDHRDRRSGLGELLRDAAAETRSGTRHDRDLPVEHTHPRAPFVPMSDARVYPARLAGYSASRSELNDAPSAGSKKCARSTSTATAGAPPATDACAGRAGRRTRPRAPPPTHRWIRHPTPSTRK